MTLFAASSCMSTRSLSCSRHCRMSSLRAAPAFFKSEAPAPEPPNSATIFQVRKAACLACRGDRLCLAIRSSFQCRLGLRPLKRCSRLTLRAEFAVRTAPLREAARPRTQKQQTRLGSRAAISRRTGTSHCFADTEISLLRRISQASSCHRRFAPAASGFPAGLLCSQGGHFACLRPRCL